MKIIHGEAKQKMRKMGRMRKKSSNVRAQMWISDYTLSLLLFLLAILLAVKIIINGFSANADFTDVKKDAFRISDILLSEGFPPDWINGSSSDIIRLGLLTDKRLNETKVTQAMNNTYINYTSLKTKLQTKYDFAIVFEESNSSLIQFNNFCVVGNASISPSCLAPPVFNFHYHNLIELNRLAVYTSSIKRMVVYVWG